VVGPLRHVHGVSDKVLTMTLSGLLLASPKPRWTEAGAHMIAIDTLVHNFLHRTGILHRLGAAHLYGLGCYQPNGCADIIRSVSATIDARQFNRSFPKVFPGSCSMRFGATALATISTFATAIASTTASHAKTAIAGCTGAAIASH
jgi:hypothetical protein